MFGTRMPFDWKTPIGYAVTISIRFGAVASMTCLCCCMLCFLGGVCWLLMAFVEDIREDIHDLNEEKNNGSKLKMKLNDLIEFHSTVKQLSGRWIYSEKCKTIIIYYSSAGSPMISQKHTKLSSPVIIYGVFQRFVAHCSWFMLEQLSKMRSMSWKFSLIWIFCVISK